MADKTELRPDIQQAKNRAGAGVGSGREIRKLESHLWEGERVEMIAKGMYANGFGLMALTDRRLLFLKDGIMSQTSEDFPFEKISSVQWGAGMIQGTITVFVSGNKAEIKNVQKDIGKLIADTVRDRISRKAPVAAALAQSVTSDDVMATLRQLGELRDAGVVTDDEFQVKKAQMLARL